MKVKRFYRKKKKQTQPAGTDFSCNPLRSTQTCTCWKVFSSSSFRCCGVAMWISEQCSWILIQKKKSRHCPPPCPILKKDNCIKFSSQTDMDCYTLIHFLSIVYTYHPNITRRHESNCVIASKCEQLYGNLLREYVLYAAISKKSDNALLALRFISHCYTLIENMLGLCSLGILESREVNVPLLQHAAVLAGLFLCVPIPTPP